MPRVEQARKRFLRISSVQYGHSRQKRQKPQNRPQVLTSPACGIYTPQINIYAKAHLLSPCPNMSYFVHIQYYLICDLQHKSGKCAIFPALYIVEE